jgi:hypothetical protein
VEELQSTLPPIRGVIHAAMALKVGFLLQLSYLSASQLTIRKGCTI